MAANIIRSYLVSLGFRQDKSGLREFTNTLTSIDKLSKGSARAVAGIAVAAEAMVTTFAFQMEKLYYVSQRTKSSVENIRALESAAQRVGLEAGTATQSLERMVASIRMNPGLRGLMDRIVGGDTSKMDQSVAMLKMIQELGKMPHFQGARFAQMFGMDEQTFLMMVQKAPELLAAQERYLKLSRESGIDQDKAAEAAREYANSLRDIGDRAMILVGQLSLALLPSFRTLKVSIVDTLDELIKFNSEIGKGSEGKYAIELDAMSYALDVLMDKLKKVGEIAYHAKEMAASLFEVGGIEKTRREWAALKDVWNRKAPQPLIDLDPNAYSKRAPSKSNTTGAPGGKSNDGEPQYGPNGELAGFRGIRESSNRTPEQRAATMRKYPSKKDAEWMRNEDWLRKNSNTGYAINPRGIGSSGPSGANANNITLNQQTDIHVTGTNNPEQTADAVINGQDRVNSDLCRNMAGCVN
jgi:hypothetical protein